MKKFMFIFFILLNILNCSNEKTDKLIDNSQLAQIKFNYPATISDKTVNKIYLYYWNTENTNSTANCNEINCRAKENSVTPLQASSGSVLNGKFKQNQSFTFRFYLTGEKDGIEVLLSKSSQQYSNCNDVVQTFSKAEESVNVTTCIVDLSTGGTSGTTVTG